MFEDEKPKPKTHEFPRRLVDMSVGELEAYIADLKAEIERTEHDMKKKKASRDAASALFKS